MRVLVVGGGGREHTLAWKLAQSPRVDEVIVAPGNGGTEWPARREPHRAAARRAGVAAEDVPGLVRLAREEGVDLVVAGPEAPLVAGLADQCRDAGIPAFGPVQAAARLEGSKAFAKRFMEAHGIPTAPAGIYEDYEEALAAVRAHGAPVVVKADGLAAGKGVTVCATVEEAEAAVRAAMVERRFGDAGRVVLVEDCLEGTEATLLAFCDGRMVVPMIPAQDYKRVHDGDMGPNTGGMGSYAPAATLTPAQVEEIRRTILQPAVDGMREAGTPYVGVLYAGLMLTAQGPKVLEFNCRFGDPETQAVLPLLETDLAEVLWACVEGRLDQVRLTWRPGGCVCVVLAAPGYPGSYPKGLPISGLDQVEADPQVVAFHAGTERKGGGWVTAGGRVLGITAWDESVPAARERACRAVRKVHFPGMHYRKDIALVHSGPSVTYAEAGVDIGRKTGLLARVRCAVEATYTEGVVAGMGPFGGIYDLATLRNVRAPVLVASTDGVGTKTKLAAALGRYRGLGHDLVNHCVNDILAQGARPLFFLDYLASSRLDPQMVEEVILGCAEACQAVRCALLG
ncbi:MAG: phosphoribosylamine--glycine ligase, partial [Anaerolineae bacterium]|nr:phosphoribosylamine--glycine ligase [Anaerolineae bacterium]